MKKRLLITILTLSVLLVACDSKRDTSENIEDNDITENNEVSSLNEKEENEKEENVLWTKETEYGNTKYSLNWSQSESGKIVISHTISSLDLNECACSILMAINDYNNNYKDNDNVEITITAFGTPAYSEESEENKNLVSFIYSDAFGVIATEKDGSSINEIPEWVNKVDTSAISDEIGKSLVTNLQDIYKQETTVAEIYLK